MDVFCYAAWNCELLIIWWVWHFANENINIRSCSTMMMVAHIYDLNCFLNFIHISLSVWVLICILQTKFYLINKRLSIFNPITNSVKSVQREQNVRGRTAAAAAINMWFSSFYATSSAANISCINIILCIILCTTNWSVHVCVCVFAWFVCAN